LFVCCNCHLHGESLGWVKAKVHTGRKSGTAVVMEQAITSWLLTVEVLGLSLGQSMWDLWLTNEHWKRFSSEYFGFPVSVISTNAAV